MATDSPICAVRPRNGCTRAMIMLTQVSSVYETEPVGYAEQPWFLNAVLEGYTELSAEELLQVGIGRRRRALGRVRSFPNAPRTIDIDILLYGEHEDRFSNTHHPAPASNGARLSRLCPLTEIAPAPGASKHGADSMESILATALPVWRRPAILLIRTGMLRPRRRCSPEAGVGAAVPWPTRGSLGSFRCVGRIRVA